MKDISRRTMLKMAGGATIAGAIPRRIVAVMENGAVVAKDNLIPADKNLSAEWKASLYARGEKEVWSREALDAIGMPIGGIATGQLYLCGDGSLGCWEIFNHHVFQDYGDTSYAKRVVPHSVEFGFSIGIGGKSVRLGRQDCEVTFNGEYPIGTMTYKAAGFPVLAHVIAYSPFIPLNALDSGLPATIFEVTLRNDGPEALDVDLTGFLENACSRSGATNPGSRKRQTRSSTESNLVVMTHGADEAHDDFAVERPDPRPEIMIADFEGETYKDWKVEGKAFGMGPAKGTLPDQNRVTGYSGTSLVNSFLGGD